MFVVFAISGVLGLVIIFFGGVFLISVSAVFPQLLGPKVGVQQLEHDFGNISTSKYFTNKLKITEFEDKLKSEYFEALFEVKGIERTDFSLDLLHINQLDNNFTIDLESPIK